MFLFSETLFPRVWHWTVRGWLTQREGNRLLWYVSSSASAWGFTASTKIAVGDEVYTTTIHDMVLTTNCLLSARANYLHPPLFFILTISFIPSQTGERPPGHPSRLWNLSIPMIFFFETILSCYRSACTLSLVFMVYHIYLSQDGRPIRPHVSGMLSLFLLMRYLATRNRKYLFSRLSFRRSSLDEL